MKTSTIRNVISAFVVILTLTFLVSRDAARPETPVVNGPVVATAPATRGNISADTIKLPAGLVEITPGPLTAPKVIFTPRGSALLILPGQSNIVGTVTHPSGQQIIQNSVTYVNPHAHLATLSRRLAETVLNGHGKFKSRVRIDVADSPYWQAAFTTADEEYVLRVEVDADGKPTRLTIKWRQALYPAAGTFEITDDGLTGTASRLRLPNGTVCNDKAYKQPMLKSCLEGCLEALGLKTAPSAAEARVGSPTP